MAQFAYTALTQPGKRVKGTIDADSLRSARVRLQQQALTVLTLQPAVTSSTGWRGWLATRSRLRLTLAELTLVTRQLATLLQAGIPLDEVLAAVAQQQRKPEARQILLGVRSKVMEGYGLAAALGEYPQVFSKLYRTTVAAGERSAKLDQILQRLADYAEKQQKIRRKILQALIYPSLMVVVSLLVVIFMLTYLVPKITEVFQDTHQTLPWITRALLAMSHVAIDDGVYIALGLLAAALGVWRWGRKPANKLRWQAWWLRLPLIGNATKTINAARFARTFGILHAASVPVLDAMQAAASLITPLPMQVAVLHAIDAVAQGSGIAAALERTDYFAPMLLHLISSGEASGQLEAMLEKASSGQEAEVDSLIDSSVALFEPVMILVMGGIVMFIVLAVMLPIFALDNFNG